VHRSIGKAQQIGFEIGQLSIAGDLAGWIIKVSARQGFSLHGR
jgi:hypothetical protein